MLKQLNCTSFLAVIVVPLLAARDVLAFQQPGRHRLHHPSGTSSGNVHVHPLYFRSKALTFPLVDPRRPGAPREPHPNHDPAMTTVAEYDCNSWDCVMGWTTTHSSQRKDENKNDWLASALRGMEVQMAQCWSNAEEWGAEAQAWFQERSLLPKYAQQNWWRRVEAADAWCKEAMPLPRSANNNNNNNKDVVAHSEQSSSSSFLFMLQNLLDPITYELSQAGLVGAMTGLLVVSFKLAIEAVRSLFYEQHFLVSHHHSLLPLIPALGGAIVGLLLWTGGGSFAPGLKGIVQQVDSQRQQQPRTVVASLASSTPTTTIGSGLHYSWKIPADALRKSMAAIATLGTGCSLGPEGPCVEIGLNVARACTQLNHQPIHHNHGNCNDEDKPSEQQYPHHHHQQQQQDSTTKPTRGWNRILLSSGAAAGVAAGFNAPIAGVFFALEIMQKAFSSLDDEQQATTTATDTLLFSNLLPMTAPNNIAPILLASVISALISQNFLGDHLALTMTHIDLQTPLLELPLYLILGGLSGVVAVAFGQSSKISQQFFAGNYGLPPVRRFMSSVPNAAKPVMGGLLCGLIGLVFPQILFFGYETLNSLLKINSCSLPTTTLALSLLLSKSLMTAVSVGSGLVGGTFALALFLGAMLGTAVQNGLVQVADIILHWSYSTPTTWHLDAMTLGAFSPIMHQLQQHAIPGTLEIGSVPAYAMVGAASTLAALFRAPLTASLLLFEVTRNYDAILPLLASAGVASIVGELLDEQLTEST